MLGARKVHKLHVNISESPMRNSDRAGMNFHSSLRSLPNKKVDLHRFAPIQSSQLAARLKPSPCRNSICYEGELVQCSPHEDRNGRTTSQSIRRLHVPPKCIRTSIHASPFLPIFSQLLLTDTKGKCVHVQRAHVVTFSYLSPLRCSLLPCKLLARLFDACFKSTLESERNQNGFRKIQPFKGQKLSWESHAKPSVSPAPMPWRSRLPIQPLNAEA